MPPFPGKLPREVGGTEEPLLVQFERIEAMSYDDGSTGWNSTFTASSAGMVASRLPDDGAAEVCAGDGDQITDHP